MKVAVVQNSSFSGVVNAFGQRCPEVYSRETIRATADGLTAGGHTVRVFEADKHLLAGLERFMPPDQSGASGGMVFNMAYGIQGECRFTHVPAMLEMAGIPYTGSSPLGHTLALDKVIAKTVLRAAGVQTPADGVMRSSADAPPQLHYPLVVKPRHESTGFGLRLVGSPDQLAEAVDAVISDTGQEALVEEYIDGREVSVALLGNDQVEVLPVVEQDFGGRAVHIVTRGDRHHRTGAPVALLCPAPLSDDVASLVRAMAVTSFHACHSRDYARVDLRIDARGVAYVLEINSMASLGLDGSFVLAAETAGYHYAQLVNRLLDIAHDRYFGVPAPRFDVLGWEADMDSSPAHDSVRKTDGF